MKSFINSDIITIDGCYHKLELNTIKEYPRYQTQPDIQDNIKYTIDEGYLWLEYHNLSYDENILVIAHDGKVFIVGTHNKDSERIPGLVEQIRPLLA